MLIKCLCGMSRKAHGAKKPKHIYEYVAAQRRDLLAQAINQCFLVVIMKENIMKRLPFYLIVSFVLFVACYENNVTAQNVTNDSQRIVGTWSVDGGSVVFTFDADGTFKVSASDPRNRKEGSYLISNSQIIFKNSKSMTTSFPSDYYFSTDEKVLVFKYTFMQVSGESNQYIWLVKQKDSTEQ